MNVECYISTNDSNYLNKKLTEVVTLKNVFIKTATDYVNPVLIIEREKIDFNYVYIPQFKRYYFVNNITSEKNGLWSVALHVDVLMSFKSDIKKINAITKRQEYVANNDLIDERLKLLNYPSIQTNLIFPNGFIDTASGNSLQYVMITTGGEA